VFVNSDCEMMHGYYRINIYFIIQLMTQYYMAIKSRIINKIVLKKAVQIIPDHNMKAYWGNGCVSPLILDFGTGGM
jgi:hypothetical protein